MTIQPNSQSSTTRGEKFGAFGILTSDSQSHSGLQQQIYANANALRHRLQQFHHRHLYHYLGSTTTTTNTNTTTTTVVAAVVTCIALLAIIMSWRNFWRRGDGASSGNTAPPHVSDNDYSYITHEDISPEYRGGGGGRGYQHQHERRSRENTTFDDKTNEYVDSDPDILLLKHHRYKYTLSFPAYAIDDGVLRVGDLRRRAAEVTRTADPQRIKLLYKGKLLDEDALPCKAEGMKQESEVLCVVSEVHPDETSEVESGDDGSAVGSAVGSGVGSAVGSSGSTRTGSKKKNKNKKNKKKQSSPPQSQFAQPVPPQQHQTQPQPIPQNHNHNYNQTQHQQQQQQSLPNKPLSTGASSLPAPAPNLKNFPTAQEQVRALSTYLHTELLPLCDEYTANTPTEPRLRDFEHKKISETVLAQVLLKADGIEPEGNPDVRNARRQLVKDAQSILNRVDQASKS